MITQLPATLAAKPTTPAPSSPSSRYLHQLLHLFWFHSAAIPAPSGNQCVHIFDLLQLRLQPDHIVTPMICTKYRDHHHLLDVMSSQTYRQRVDDFLEHWLSTLSGDYTVVIQQLRFYTHTLFVYNSHEKPGYSQANPFGSMSPATKRWL